MMGALTMLQNERKLINLYDLRGRTPLHFACRNGFVNTAKVLLDFGANLFARDNEFLTPMDDAFERQRQQGFDEDSSSLVKVIDEAS